MTSVRLWMCICSLSFLICAGCADPESSATSSSGQSASEGQTSESGDPAEMGGSAQTSGPDTAGSSDGTSGGKRKGTIGYTTMSLTNPFFKVIGDSMTEEAAKHGYDVIVVSADDDVNKQSNQIDDFIRPEYLFVLFTNDLGIKMLTGCAIWMSMGVLIMRKMINFNI